MCLVNQELPTLETHAFQNLHDELEELGVVDGPSKLVMTEVSWTIVVVLATSPAHFAILQYAHARVKETTELPLRCGRGGDLADRATNDLLRTEDTELDADNRLSFGRMG